jgi:hypothetical protein
MGRGAKWNRHFGQLTAGHSYPNLSMLLQQQIIAAHDGRHGPHN